MIRMLLFLVRSNRKVLAVIAQYSELTLYFENFTVVDFCINLKESYINKISIQML